jgi:hypothetical protein
MITLCAHPFKLAICFSRAMPHLYAFHTLPHSRALRVPHSMLTSSTNTSCPCYSSVVPPPSTACPPPQLHTVCPLPLQHGLPSHPPLQHTRQFARATAVTARRWNVTRPTSPYPAQQAFLFLGSQGLYVYSWPATLPTGWASLHPPTAISLPLPLPAANIVLDSSPRLESSIRVLDNRTMPPSSSQPPPPPSLASCVTQALQPGDLLQLSGEDQSTCPACGHLCPPSSPEAPWQGQSGSGQCSTAKQRNGTLHSWAFRQ